MYKSKYEKTITKTMLENDMYIHKLSQRAIAKKYNVGKGTIQNLQALYNLRIVNVYLRRVPETLTNEQKEIALGSSIADGHIFRKNNKRNGALKFAHSIKQEKYLDHKFNIFKEFVRTEPTIQVSRIKNKTYKCKSFRTLSHPYFTELHEMLYVK